MIHMYEFANKKSRGNKNIVIGIEDGISTDEADEMAHLKLFDVYKIPEVEKDDWIIEEVYSITSGERPTTLRYANREELEDLYNYFIYECGYDEENAFQLVQTHHFIILEDYVSDSPGYVGKILIAIHCDISFHKIYGYNKEGRIEPIDQEEAMLNERR